MNTLRFYILDVFSESRYAGNQLAVFRNTAGLSTEHMQKIAREINFAESTFIHADGQVDGGYDVRIFTPDREMPFAGHPTLGTAYIIHEKILEKPSSEIVLNLKAGKIPVNITYQDYTIDQLWMTQLNPEFGQVLSRELMAGILTLNEDDFYDQYPVQFVSTGFPFVIVPLKTLDAVKRAKLNWDKYELGVEAYKADAIHLFAPETYHPQNQLNARMFAPELQVVEDAATGSANGCLAGYLAKYRFLGSPEVDVRVEQGYEMGRPSLLLLKAKEVSESEIEVKVGGHVQFVAEGEWTV